MSTRLALYDCFEPERLVLMLLFNLICIPLGFADRSKLPDYMQLAPSDASFCKSCDELAIGVDDIGVPQSQKRKVPPSKGSPSI